MADINSLYELLREADRQAQTGDKQAQADAQKIYNTIETLKQQQREAEETPPMLGGIIGGNVGAAETAAIGGYKLLKGAKQMYDADQMRKQTQLAQTIAGNIKPPASSTPPAAPGGSAWNKQLTGLDVPGSQMSKQWLDLNRNIQNVVSPMSDLPEFRGGTVSPAGIITPPQRGPVPPAGMAPQAAPSSAFSNAVDRAKQFGSSLPRVGGTAMRVAGPIAGGFGAGYEGIEAMNRFERGDPIGGTISAIGAGAGAASMYPPAAPIGLPISYGMMGLNYLLDKYRGKPEAKSVLEKAEGGLVGGLSSLQPQQPSALTAQMAQQTPPQLGLPPVHSLDMMSSPDSVGSRPFPDAYNPNMRYAPPFKEGGSTTPAWQRKEGKSPSGGLNAVGRASYKRETGGELKAPQPEGGSRKKSFCARMGGMKKKLTSSETANDPDSRINKALRKWKC